MKVYLISLQKNSNTVVSDRKYDRNDCEFFQSVKNKNLITVSSLVLVLDFFESSDGLSGNVASSVTGPSSSGGAEGRVDLGV